MLLPFGSPCLWWVFLGLVAGRGGVCVCFYFRFNRSVSVSFSKSSKRGGFAFVSVCIKKSVE